jgi:YVTN family beta-propeller protein
VIETIQLTGELIRPMGGATSPDGSQVFISTGRGKNVVVIDTASNKPVAFIEVGERPWGIAASNDGKLVFTANGPSNDVSIVDLATRTVKAKVPVGNRPWGVVYVP